ncbi:TPA: hypothetical protein EYN98_00315 [Candidatus Poribacteria bacterium]|nr:hypothetical protein [Candidatus Poribacteria bacterium]HIB91856.1 hypothetical protein [Candidatus Poribacteria bacterium]
MPEFVKLTEISSDDIEQNLQFFDQMLDTENGEDFLILMEILSQFQQAIENGMDLVLEHERLGQIGRQI